MKVLILPDGLNWIVDRNCNELISQLKHIEFTVYPYTKIDVDTFVYMSKDHDIVHYFNWDIEHLKGALPRITTPFLMSVRSHRYKPFVEEVKKRPNTWFHVINEDLLPEFPNSTYIPNGIFPYFERDFVVGFAGRPELHLQNYKGVHLIEEACKQLGVKFKPALGEIPPEEMPEYYKSIDVYVCASEGEGFSTPVMECLAYNKPVITVDTGVPRKFDIVKVERSVEGIKKGILKFYTKPLVEPYSWEKIAPRYEELYKKILNL